MVDLGDDLDVVAAVVGEVAGLLAEKVVEAAEVVGAPLDRHRRDLGEGLERAAAGPGNDHAVGAGGHLQPPGDPGRGHQGRDRDRHHLHGRLEARPRGEPLEHLPQRMLGEPAGDEVEARASADMTFVAGPQTAKVPQTLNLSRGV